MRLYLRLTGTLFGLFALGHFLAFLAIGAIARFVAKCSGTNLESLIAIGLTLIVLANAALSFWAFRMLGRAASTSRD